MVSRNDSAIWSGLFRISAESGQTLQAQIRQAIVAAILDRQIAASLPLPSCRVLAEKLGVARGTVVLAFQQLVDQGFLIARERRGHFVNPEFVSGLGNDSPRPEPRPDRINWGARRRINSNQPPESAYQGNWIKTPYPFVYGQFDPGLFPTAEWRECNRMALAVLEIRNWAGDVVDRDDPLLIEQIQARLLPRRGIFANPDEIIVTLGAQHALYMLATLLMGNRTRVAMEEPGYPDARGIFRLSGASVAPVAVDEEGIDPDAIPRDADYVFVTPNHHCPTMVPLAEERRQRLLDDADRHDQIIIEDGYDSQLVDDSPQQALKSIDRSGRVIYVGSMSKTLAPGLRIGYIVADAGLIAELRALRRYMLRHPPANNQRAVALFLSLGHHEALVRRLSAAFSERRATLAESVSNWLPDWQPATAPGGTSLWLKGPVGTNVRNLAKDAAERGVLIEPGGRFFDQPEKQSRFMRLGISSIALNHIEPGIRELSEAAGRLRSAA